VGEVSTADLPRYFQSCDVFCSPAVKGESFGMVLLEAMALGKPVVASAIDGYKTVLTDRLQGRLVPPRQSAALAEALVEVLRSPDARRRYGEHGILTARAYSWDRVATRLLRFYDDLRAGQAGNPLPWARSWQSREDGEALPPLGLEDGVQPCVATGGPAAAHGVG
jgi:glycosyltransferase involved in cell wall biosynthesis